MLQGGSPGFKPHYPQIVTKRFRRTLAIFEECPIEETSRYITLFFKGAYSVIGFSELMRMFLVRLMQFLR